jgi:LysM repeat protein
MTKKALFYKHLNTNAFSSLVIAIVIFSYPTLVNAGFLSIFSDTVEASDIGDDRNSQTITLLEATPADPTLDQGGADILIIDGSALMPETGPLGTAADIETYIPDSDEITTYIVRQGDTLSQIAEMYDVSVNTILWANDLPKGTALKKDQMLVILPITGISHTVKKGDTLKSIATKYKGDIVEIGVFNGITEESALAIGDKIIIPEGELNTPTVTKTGPKITKSKKGEKTWGTNAPAQDGYYVRPISGGRMSQGVHGFNGVDLAAPTGTPIRAAASGTVIVERHGGWGGGYGNYIVIKHNNGTQTLYAHNSKNLVSIGQTVSQGQQIALLGSTGRSTGPHVHFEVRGAKNPSIDGSWKK